MTSFFAKAQNARYYIGKFFDAGNFPFYVIPDESVRKLLESRTIQNYRDRRVIFCASTGRAGSSYLAHLLSTVENCSAFHEPVPRMNGRILSQVIKYGLEPTYSSRSQKILGIALRMSILRHDSVYAETSNMFIKTYFDVVCDYFRNVDVIVLRRNPASILKSLVELGYFTDKSPAWKAWMTDPFRSDPGLAECFPNGDQYDRAIAYIIHVEQNTQRFVESYPHCRVHFTTIEQISRPDGAQTLIELLGLPWNDRSLETVRTVHNKAVGRKAGVGIESSDSRCVARLESYLSRASDCGLVLPDPRVIWQNTRLELNC